MDNENYEAMREELNKVLISKHPQNGLANLASTGLLEKLIPEFKATYNFNQHNKHHDKDVFMHILSVVGNVPPTLDLRLAALLHDIGKPRCFTLGDDGQGHFINHHKISADMARQILTRLSYNNKTIDKVCILVYEHMSRFDKLRTPNIKKFINRVGVDNLSDLFELQIADIKGCAKEYQDFSNVYKLEKTCNKVLNEKQSLSIKDLRIGGRDLIDLGFTQDKEIGDVLTKLLNMVIENPELNDENTLLEIVKSKK